MEMRIECLPHQLVDRRTCPQGGFHLAGGKYRLGKEQVNEAQQPGLGCVG